MDIKTKIMPQENMGHFIFHFRGKPISKVEIIGIATKIVTRAKNLTFYVDDGTGVIRCVQYISPDDNVVSSSICVGDTVAVKGLVALSETNEDEYGYNLRVSMIEAVEDPHCEVFHWLQVMKDRSNSTSVESSMQRS